jgi:hypothetical protein
MIRKILLVFFGTLVCILAGAQKNSEGEMPQYLLKDFKETRILMKNGQVKKEIMNFNIVTEMMVYYKEDKYWDLINPEMVDTVYLDGRKIVPIGKYFFEVLYNGQISLFLQHKGSLLSAGDDVGYGGKSQLAAVDRISSIDVASGRFNLPLSDDFIVNPTPVFWIRRNNEMLDFLNEKQFLKYFPGNEDEIKSFIKSNRYKIDKPVDLIKIIEFCNNLK